MFGRHKEVSKTQERFIFHIFRYVTGTDPLCAPCLLPKEMDFHFSFCFLLELWGSLPSHILMVVLINFLAVPHYPRLFSHCESHEDSYEFLELASNVPGLPISFRSFLGDLAVNSFFLKKRLRADVAVTKGRKTGKVTKVHTNTRYNAVRFCRLGPSTVNLFIFAVFFLLCSTTRRIDFCALSNVTENWPSSVGHSPAAGWS